MEPDPREPTGDLGYDTAHEVTGGPRPEGETRPAPAEDRRDDAAGDYGYDEAHDFRR
jgi:hypothetical protein